MNHISKNNINFVNESTEVFSSFSLDNRKRYVYLLSENLRNFQLSKDSIVVLTHIAWAAIVASAHRQSQGLHLRRDIAGSRFFFCTHYKQSHL